MIPELIFICFTYYLVKNAKDFHCVHTVSLTLEGMVGVERYIGGGQREGLTLCLTRFKQENINDSVYL